MSDIKCHVGGQLAVFPLYKLKSGKAQKSSVVSNCLASLSGSCKDKTNKQNLRDSDQRAGHAPTREPWAHRTVRAFAQVLRNCNQQVSDQARPRISSMPVSQLRSSLLFLASKATSLRKLLIIYFQFLCKYYSQSQISIEVSGAKNKEQENSSAHQFIVKSLSHV